MCYHSPMRKHAYWVASVGMTILLRLWLLVTAAVPFNGDEAVVALMARHILQGARPRFFYGQAYMGSLDAYLIAGGFAVFGEHIWVIRVVQMLLYCGFIYTAWLLARRLFADPRAADYTALLLAVPPVVVTTYTTATLGGYGESLIFGNLILLLGVEVVYGKWQDRPVVWLALGLVGGLAFWTLGLAAVYLLPVGVVGLLRLRVKRLPLVLLAAAGFVLGGLPWWSENFANDWAALDFLLGRSELALVPPPPLERMMGLVFLAVPALFGFRVPWEGGYGPLWMVAAGVLLMAGLLIFAIEARRRKLGLTRSGGGLLLGLFVGGIIVLFVGTAFGMDSTGRYLLPLWLPIAMGFGAFAAWLAGRSKPAAWAFMALLAGFFLAGNLRAAAQPEGLTTQFAPITRFNNDHDQELIEFLTANGLDRGYSNYWVTFRLAFLSDETLIYSPMLPYKEDLTRTPHDNRYPLYDQLVRESDSLAYITTLHPELDARLAAEFARLGVTYRETQIGPYRVYFELAEPVRPDELDIFREP